MLEVKFAVQNLHSKVYGEECQGDSFSVNPICQILNLILKRWRIEKRKILETVTEGHLITVSSILNNRYESTMLTTFTTKPMINRIATTEIKKEFITLIASECFNTPNEPMILAPAVEKLRQLAYGLIENDNFCKPVARSQQKNCES
ncbi:CLUMA_CG019672, isoform A [Clunio marinus]|uniref:CLUMA_CG019672, isoform A n=1 Tax=Clunio marinus TaxID=568069 RepID=A0A1J1J2C4_9DIPT|nr:CLUMA_CG019672, isoform A [Clunio marinus]